MAYRPVDDFPNLPAIERKTLAFWDEIGAFEKRRALNRVDEGGKPHWSFLDGPITANNPMGVHHAWGRSLKDMYQRYHGMCGQDQRYQNGFDCQGLWVEVEVEKEHGFSTKRDIESYGVAKFVEDCKARVRKYAQVQTEQSIRLGYWMDWDDSYFTMTEENNYTIWSFLKKCFDRGFVYKGFDSMPWCPRCGTGLSQMELHEGYKWVSHLAVFVRFPIAGRDREALLVWTTTPWTLTANVAAAVHPEMEYVKVRAGEWTYWVGKENFEAQRVIEHEETVATGKKRHRTKLKTLQQILDKHATDDAPMTVLDTAKGEDLIGWTYEGPFDDLPAAQAPGGYPYENPELADRDARACHRVIAWSEVTGSEGTGIVHIAPGCGREDHELGKTEGLVCIGPLNESGHYLEGLGDLEGRHANEVGDEIAQRLEDGDRLVGREQYLHRYPHCWRDGTPVVYRLVDEWYISMDWRQEIIDSVSKITWIPDYGERLELDWLRNMGDWMISKKRFWGLALPIWQCDDHEAEDDARCEWFTVIGGREELREKAIAGWDAFDGNTPHRPWVDAVKIKCEKCGGTASRVPDVGNPWLDAGIVPFSTMGYNTDRAHWDKWYPAELVLECFPGQFRNWFYALLAMGTMMQEDRWADRTGGAPGGASGVVPPFKTLLGHALVRDEQGHEMHKSAGNAVEFNAAAEKIGAEVMRYIYAAQNPVVNLNFPDIADDRDERAVHLDKQVLRRLLTLWNSYSFYITYATADGLTPVDFDVPLEQRSELDRWIVSKFERLLAVAHESFSTYRIHVLMERFEAFVEDLSDWYIRRSRRRFWKSESDTDKITAYATLHEMLEGICRLMAPILPFLTEEIWQNVVRSVTPDAPESVHLTDYPEPDPSRIDETVEARIDTVVRYKNHGRHLRERSNIKVRQPLATLSVFAASDAEVAALGDEALAQQLLDEINVKRVEVLGAVPEGVALRARANPQTVGPKYGKALGAIRAAVEAADPAEVRKAVTGPGSFRVNVNGADIDLGPEDIDFDHTAPDNLVFLFDGDAFVALDTEITEPLRLEGTARDFVRGVQMFRKDLELQVDDRITLSYRAADEPARAIETWADYIRRETLATDLVAEPDLDAAGGREIKVGGDKVVIGVAVAARQPQSS